MHIPHLTHTTHHTHTLYILSINHVPDTIISFNLHSSALPWPSHCRWAESLSPNCANCPLNPNVAHMIPWLCSAGLLGPPLCSLEAQGLLSFLSPESQPNLPQPWVLPIFPPSDSTSGSIYLCSWLSPPAPAPP